MNVRYILEPSSSGDWQDSAPEPLRRPLSPPEAYPIAALGEILGAAAERIHAVVQAPEALCGQSILCAASLAAQAHADVAIDGRREPLSLWGASVGESGERKSAADGWALRAHRDFERDEADRYRVLKSSYEIELTAYRAATKAAETQKANLGPDAVRRSLAALGEPPEQPLSPWLIVPEATLEGLHRLFQSGRPSLGLFNDDAGDFLDGHAMSRENRVKSAAGLSKLWDDGQFSRVRAGDGASKFYGRRLAMHVMIQPVIAERVLSDEVLCGQGFLPRALLAWPESSAGRRKYVSVDLSADQALLRYWGRMRALLDVSPRLRSETRNELEPRGLALSSEAKAYWIDVANAIEQDMAGEFANVRAWASKAGAQVLRIAGVLSVVERPGADSISKDLVERASLLGNYYLKEAARIVGTASVPAKIRRAELLLDWCSHSGRSALYSSDALRNGPSAIRTSEAFREAVTVLEETGWAKRIEGGAQIDGRHRTHVWQVRRGD